MPGPVVVVTAAAVIALLACGGCASRSAESSFVKKDDGFVDVGGAAEPVTPVQRADIERAAAEAVAKRAAGRQAPLASIEGQDPEIRDALAALRSAPSSGAHIRVAEAYMRVRIRDVAYDHYTEALRLEPRNVTAFDGRARLWRDVGLLGPALTDAHRAKYFDPTSAEVRNTLGTILERRGLCHEALTEYREAARLKPEAAWAQQNVTRLADTCP